MSKRNILLVWASLFIIVLSCGILISLEVNDKAETNILKATVTNIDGDFVTVRDKNNIIYTFGIDDNDLSLGEDINIEYTGCLSKNDSFQDNEIISYTSAEVTEDENGIPTDFLDNGIFKDYYKQAYFKLKEMSLNEKIGQILLVRYPDSDGKAALEKNYFGGYVFFEKDFKGKTANEVKNMINSLQDVSNIPILVATDEEGGKVVRVSSNPNLASTPFKSSRQLYLEGGMDAIKKDTIKKSNLLYNLGINVNLAPVVDISLDPNDYMYDRSLGENTEVTSEYAKTVISASKGLGVSYTLKHFPGYGNNKDTHTGSVTDSRSYEDILKNDIPPFKAGINEGAEAVLVSHNTVQSIDDKNPASLSPSVHNLLRGELGFTGIIMTDDLDMGATSNITDATVKAILAGNDLIITTDYQKSLNEIKDAINDKTIDEGLIDKLAFRVIAWKYYKGLIFEKQK